jgi:hypothetical protein
MKTLLKPTAMAILLGVLIVSSCKKVKPSDPVNPNSNCESCTICPSSYLSMDTFSITPNGGVYGYVNTTNYVSQIPYTLRNGTQLAISQIEKSPNGFYAIDGFCLDFNLANMNLAQLPNQVSFVHASQVYNDPNPPLNADSNTVNVKFANTPLIRTTPDSLAFYLAPYGYSVQHFQYPSFIMHGNYQWFPGPGGGAIVADSIVIQGPAISSLKVGALLFESELRNICFKTNP